MLAIVPWVSIDLNFVWTKLAQMAANPLKPHTLNPAKIKMHNYGI